MISKNEEQQVGLNNNRIDTLEQEKIQSKAKHEMAG